MAVVYPRLVSIVLGGQWQRGNIYTRGWWLVSIVLGGQRGNNV